jgi:hypothetical protein
MSVKTGAYSADKFSEKQLRQDKDALPDFPESKPEPKTTVTPSSKWQIGKYGNDSKKKKWS